MSKTLFATSSEATHVLAGIDLLADVIEKDHVALGLEPKQAEELALHLDKTADLLEVACYGADNLAKRKIKLAKDAADKVAKVIQKDSDEPYMDTFNAPQKPHQSDADEPYMAHYRDDQTEAVEKGKSTTGQPLAK